MGREQPKASSWCGLFGVVAVGALLVSACVESPVSGAECASGEYEGTPQFSCENGYTVPTGADVVEDVGPETTVDAGPDAEPDTRPGCSPTCEVNEPCVEDRDCQTGVCDLGGEATGVCAAPSCSDGVENGDETGEDCGGSCAPCDPGADCRGPSDCETGVCDNSTCQEATCSDGVQNGGERDVDCGGGCGKCGMGQSCMDDSHCESGYCDQEDQTCQAPRCDDEVRNGDETDVDCGGAMCSGCEADEMCDDGQDCQSGVCTEGTCAAPTCNDNRQNGLESDEDCGGPDCKKCSLGSTCRGDDDCEGENCVNGTCEPSCSDGTENQGESDVDCGGPCAPCGLGESCDGDDANCVGANVCNSSDVCEVQLHEVTMTRNGEQVTAVRWTNGDNAASCDAYINPTNSNYAYAGQTGDGPFWIEPGSASQATALECRFENVGSGSPEGWTRVYFNDFENSGSAGSWMPSDRQQCSLPSKSSPNYVLGGDENSMGASGFLWGGDRTFTATATLNFEADVPHTELDLWTTFIRNDEWEKQGEDNEDSFRLTVDGSTDVYGPNAVPGAAGGGPTVCGDSGRVVDLGAQTSIVTRSNPMPSVDVEAESECTADNEWWALDDLAVWVR